MHVARGFELTYCTNIHAAEGWPQVFSSVRRYAPELKRRLSSGSPFGVGLRLANSESIELLQGGRLDEFADFLRSAGLYVALINGYPFGHFHGRPLKDQVFAPDWLRTDRVDYTLRLIEILTRLVPAGMEGGISTCPLSYKPWFKGSAPADEHVMIRNVVHVVQALVEASRRSGALIHLDIEPEPDGWIETTAEFVQFFKQLLRQGVPQLVSVAQLSASEAEQALRDHVAMCYDACHLAVEREEPGETIQSLQREGIRIGRVQISSALKVKIPESAADRERLRERLSGFSDAVYLHQIVGDRERFADLPEGLAQLPHACGSEWRIHYHVPLFLESYGALGSTQDDVRAALAAVAPSTVRHLEIETYTWGVLPAGLKADLVDSIEREYRWVLDQL